MLPTGRGRSLKKRSWPVVTRKRSPRRSCDLRVLCSGDVLLIDSQNSLCSLATLAGLTVYPPASQHGVFARSRLLSRCGDLDRSSRGLRPLDCLTAGGVPPRCASAFAKATAGKARRRLQKCKMPDGINHRAFYSGDVLLSRGLSPYYHRGCSVSLPCSEWERVGPLRYCHQNSAPKFRRRILVK